MKKQKVQFFSSRAAAEPRRGGRPASALGSFAKAMAGRQLRPALLLPASARASPPLDTYYPLRPLMLFLLFGIFFQKEERGLRRITIKGRKDKGVEAHIGIRG